MARSVATGRPANSDRRPGSASTAARPRSSVSTSSDRLAVSRFVFEMGDTTHLDRVLNAVRRIDAVYDVYRVSDG